MRPTPRRPRPSVPVPALDGVCRRLEERPAGDGYLAAHPFVGRVAGSGAAPDGGDIDVHALDGNGTEVKLAGVEDQCHPLVHQDDQVRACDHGGRGGELVHRSYRASPATGLLTKKVSPTYVVPFRLHLMMVTSNATLNAFQPAGP